MTVPPPQPPAGSSVFTPPKVTTFLVVLGLIALFIVFAKNREAIKTAAQYAVSTYGLPALFLLTWLSDVIIQPIPADVLVFGSTFGGASIWEVALTAGLASALGGLTGYFVGRWFGPWRFRRVFGKKLLRMGRDLFRRHGAMAIFVSGVSPIPYSGVCWVGGIYRMPFIEVAIASIFSRTLRYVFFGFIGVLF